jgi:hypothetical protein
MEPHPATTRVIKAGRSRRRFLFFTGSRKHSEDQATQSLSQIFIPALIAFGAIVISITLYLFFTGKLT